MKRILAIAMAFLAMTACTKDRTNPFFAEWDTPFGIPPFEQIQEADYLPALQEGIRQHDAEIEKIINNPELKADTLHPNAAGYRMMAEAVAEVLRRGGAIR